MELHTVKNILEAILLSVDKPMDLRQLDKLFEADEDNRPAKEQILDALQALQEDYQNRGMALTEVASGYRIQVREDYTGWISRLWEEKVPRYSRALLETLVLIAYRQPITRGEIEEIRGVSVSSHIMKTLLEREWVRVLGHKDVPGKPSMYGTTSDFLDYFNLKSLDELPPLSDIQDLDKLHPSLELEDEPLSNEGETDESKTTAEVAAETESGTGNTHEQPNAPDDSYEVGVEESDEILDETLEQEKRAVSPESSDPALDESLEESPEQDIQREFEEIEVAAETPSEMDNNEEAPDDSSEAEVKEVDEEQVQQLADEAAEITESETIADLTVERESATRHHDDPHDALDGSDEADVGEVDEVLDETPERDNQDLSRESFEPVVVDEDEPVEVLPEQAIELAAEVAEITESEAIADLAVETESATRHHDDPCDALDGSDEADVGEVDEVLDETPGRDNQDRSRESFEPVVVDEDEPVEVLPEQTIELTAEEVDTAEIETTIGVIREAESETDSTHEPVNASNEADVEDAEEDVDEEQDKQVLSYQPSETADMDEAVEESPEHDMQPEPERSGWTKLAQMLWERLKKLMQKARKRQGNEWNPRPEPGNKLELLTGLCYTFKYV